MEHLKACSTNSNFSGAGKNYPPYHWLHNKKNGLSSFFRLAASCSRSFFLLTMTYRRHRTRHAMAATSWPYRGHTHHWPQPCPSRPRVSTKSCPCEPGSCPHLPSRKLQPIYAFELVERKKKIVAFFHYAACRMGLRGSEIERSELKDKVVPQTLG